MDIDNGRLTMHTDPQAEGYAHTRTPETLARIEVPGMADITVDLGGLL